MNKMIKCCIFCLLTLPAFSFGESFSELPDDVRVTLSPFKAKWESMPTEKQQSLIKEAQRWNAKPRTASSCANSL